jgi:hypothetical protein
METKLTIIKQRKIIKEKFQKLKSEFLTSEQSIKVHLRELSDNYWLTNRPHSCGFTVCYYDRGTKEIIHMYFIIRLFYKHEKLDFLLDTIAHEFAHVYLNFFDPDLGHGKKHDKQKERFLKYLLDN